MEFHKQQPKREELHGAEGSLPSQLHTASTTQIIRFLWKKAPYCFLLGERKSCTHTHTKAVPTQAAEKHTGLPLMKNKWMINWTNATWNKMYLGQKKLLDDEILINSLVTEKDNEDSFQNFSGMCWLKKRCTPNPCLLCSYFSWTKQAGHLCRGWLCMHNTKHSTVNLQST